MTEKQADQIINRIENILEKLPEAIKQATKRIIEGDQVESKVKILSLYEDDINVIKRGKANASVEFGNVLWLAENRNGLLGDWFLYKENIADNAEGPLKRCVEELENIDTETKLEKVWTDRGMDSRQNREMLEEKEIFNGIYPKSVKDLEEKMRDESYAQGQRRRGSTEARVAIFKRKFVGDPQLEKGYANKRGAIGWEVLAHNLWVLARLPKAIELEEEKAA